MQRKYLQSLLSLSDVLDCDEEDIEGNLEAIQERFELIDTSALSDDDNWWSIILEQLLEFIEFIGVTNNELLAIRNKEINVKDLYKMLGTVEC